MIRRIIAAALFASSTAILTACDGGSVRLPDGVNVEVPSIAASDLSIPTSLPSMSDVINAGIDTQLTAAGFVANPDKSEYTKKGPDGSGDLVLVMSDGKPRGIKYNHQLQECVPSEATVLAALATGLAGGTNQQMVEQLCAS